MSEAKKRGRPKGSTADETKEGLVRFRCDLAEKGAWVMAARRKGQTLAEWFRSLGNDAAGH